MPLLKNSKVNLAVGPAGRAVAQPIDPDILQNLYQHITMERVASAQYFASSLWFLEREMKGFAKYFYTESKNEQEHAYSFCKYLIARGQNVEMEEVSVPIQEWESLEQLVSYSFQMEADITTSLQQLYSMAERTGDTRTNVFLDPVIESQTSSEDELAYLVGRVRFADKQPSAILIIDNELSED